MALPHDELVRYCDSLWNPDAALDILIAAFAPPNEKPVKFTATHCPNGHEYTYANSYFQGGYRYCRACRKARSQRRQRLAG